MEKEKITPQQLLIPLAIVITGIIIAGAIIYVNKTDTAQLNNDPQALAEEIQPINANDHILGNFKTAQVFILEFSDLECPFCKRFHETLKEIMKEYGDSGNVAWVYRHFPLTSLHSKAFKEAEATECAGELGGPVKFWEYTDRLLQITPSNDGLDLSLLPTIAKDVGLDAKTFTICLESGRHKERVDANLKDAIASGGRGTPHTLIMTRDGKKVIPIQGAQPIETVRSTIEQLLSK